MENQVDTIHDDLQNKSNFNSVDKPVKMNKNFSRWIKILIILVVLLSAGISIYGYFLLSAGEKNIKQNSEQNLEQRIKLSEIVDKPFLLIYYTYSPDGQRVAYAEPKYVGSKRSFAVYLNDKKLGEYDSVSDFYFSPDSQSLAYKAENNNQSFIVLNGNEGKKYASIYYSVDPIFSPDSKHFAYVVGTEVVQYQGKRFLVYDGKEKKQYDDIRDFTFSNDSQSFAYIAKEGNKEFVVINDKEGKRYDSISQGYPLSDSISVHPSNLLFTSDGRVVYLASENGKKFVVINDKEGNKHEDIGRVVISPDNKNIAYFAKEGNKGFLILNGNEQKEFTLYDFMSIGAGITETNDFYYFDFFQFSPKNKNLAYVASEHGLQFVIVDGKEGKKYKTISSLQFSPDSSMVVYDAWQKDPENFFVVINGKESEYLIQGYFRSSFVFSPDSKKIAFVAENKNEMFVVLNGAEGKHYVKENVGGPSGSIYHLVFSPDSKNFAYRVREPGEFSRTGESFIVVNEIEYADSSTDDPNYSKIIFSNDSKYVGYNILISNKGQNNNGVFWINKKIQVRN